MEENEEVEEDSLASDRSYLFFLSSNITSI